jgi:predicted alpha/beta-hydrolase family hydrolase
VRLVRRPAVAETGIADAFGTRAAVADMCIRRACARFGPC